MFVMEPPGAQVPGVAERQAILNSLLDAVKQCQIRFGGRTELATESDSRVVCLCSRFESVLQHGLRRNLKTLSAFRQVTEMMKGLNLLNNEPEPDYWHFVRNHLNKHEYERYMLLKSVNTDLGRGRAWLRSALNEHSLERYMHMFLSDSHLISQYYESWAILMDEERSSMMPMMSAGLGSILFAINIDNADLNNSNHSSTITPQGGRIPLAKSKDVEPQPVVARPSIGNKKKKKKKRPSSQVVSFDDDDASSGREWFLDLPQGCNSAPATCVSSPVSMSSHFATLTDKVSLTIPIATSNNKSGSTGGDSQLESDGQLSESDLARSWTPGITIELDPNVAVDDGNQRMVKNHSFPTLGLPGINNSSKNLYHSSKRSSSTNLATTLTPISDTSVGELIPFTYTNEVPLSEDSISIPSFGEETENAAAALAIAQRLSSWSNNPSTTTSTSSQSAPADGREWEGRARTDTLTMTNDELREALLVVLQRKDETDEKNTSLRNLLDREMELSAGLRAEMEEMKKQQSEKMEKLDTKIQATNRENELLKHQLKKYIMAVQMLKRDGTRAQEAISGIVGEIHPAAPEPKQYIDHQYEATEYERKLVQVAEMHGELMEFNERLHRLLLYREATIRRLREELIDLRGPLPDDNQTSDDDISITSDYDASSQTASARPLINIWVPSAFLSGRATDIHHVYQVYVRIRDEEWNVYRRYSRFYSFHKALKKRLPIVHSFDFPPKKTINKKDCKVVEERRRRLQNYLRGIINLLLQTNCELANNPDKETFMALLPFFRDQSSELRPPHQRRGLSRSGPTNSQHPLQAEEPTAHLYTGL